MTIAKGLPLLIIASLFFGLSYATDYGTQDEATLLAQTKFAMGDYTVAYVYFQYNDNITSELIVQKAKFYPKVDYFSQLDVLNTSSHRTDKSAQIWVKWANFTTHKKSFSMVDRFVGSWSVVFNMMNGIPKGIAWDGDCGECITPWCLNDTCTLDVTENPPCDDSDSLKKDPNRCGVKVYVAFEGTDKNDRALTSTGSLPSRFQKYSVTMTAYEAAAGFWTDFAPWA